MNNPQFGFKISWLRQVIKTRKGWREIMVGRKIKRLKKAKYDEVSADLIYCLREIVRRSVMTLAALRDPDRRYVGWSTLPANIVHDVRDAYGWSSASVRGFAPSPHEVGQMEVVLPWLAWVRREESDAACRRILGWAMGAPVWRLAQREGCSERTIHNRIDRSVVAIIRRFVGVEIEIEAIDEPWKGAPFAMVYDFPAGPHGGEVQIRKVYVGGIGFVKGGKRIRTGQEKYDLVKMSA